VSYVVLARKYRPQRFVDLVGQEHVSQTLKNAVKSKRHAHAYLFTGPRGVGKTSAARLLAKALRCTNPSDEAEPCNECEACLSVNQGNALDVIEIDAASNTGVDNIRELRENVGYMASSGQYRIYIIDEVHMLSTAAFNALLKTLEEPPEHVLFIFATTEVHKVPATIQSRCQRFDFKKISGPVLTKNLLDICKIEGIKIDEAAMRTIVTESEGCLRDAQSLLDQAIALCGDSIEIATLEKALGLVDRTRFFALLKNFYNHDAGAALELCSEMLGQGIDPKILLGRIVYFFRDLHFYNWTGKLIGDDVDYHNSLKAAREALSEDEIVRALDLSLNTQSRLSSSSNASFAMEALVVKLCLQRPIAASAPSPQARTPSTNNQRSSTPTPSRQMNAPLSREMPPMPEDEGMPMPEHVQTQPSSSAAGGSRADLAKLENFLHSKKPAWVPVIKSIITFEMNESNLKVVVREDFAGKRLASQDGKKLLTDLFKLTGVDISFAEANNGKKKPSTHEVYQNKVKESREHSAIQEAIKTFEATIKDAKVINKEQRR